MTKDGIQALLSWISGTKKGKPVKTGCSTVDDAVQPKCCIITPPKVCSLNVSSVADTGDSGLNGMYEPTSYLHNNRWVGSYSVIIDTDPWTDLYLSLSALGTDHQANVPAARWKVADVLDPPPRVLCKLDLSSLDHRADQNQP
jgi:hypothetical protein